MWHLSFKANEIFPTGMNDKKLKDADFVNDTQMMIIQRDESLSTER